MEALEDGILRSMRTSNRLHFNLDQMNMNNFIEFSKNPVFLEGNITNWELNTILRDPVLLNKTTFYGPGGVVVPPPVAP